MTQRTDLITGGKRKKKRVIPVKSRGKLVIRYEDKQALNLRKESSFSGSVVLLVESGYFME